MGEAASMTAEDEEAEQATAWRQLADHPCGDVAEALVAIVTRDVGLLEDSHQPRDQR